MANIDWICQNCGMAHFQLGTDVLQFENKCNRCGWIRPDSVFTITPTIIAGDLVKSIEDGKLVVAKGDES